MCLIIEKGTDKKKAESNILVYKCLDSYCANYYTPYQNFPVYFEDGKCVMNTPHFSYERNGRHTIVKEGIHSYYKRFKAEYTEFSFNHYFGTKMYYAIIPKGTNYYIGNSGNVVSTELIIFKTKEDYKKYVEKSEKICIIDEDSLSLQEIQ